MIKEIMRPLIRDFRVAGIRGNDKTEVGERISVTC